jgi:hypothetical protein
VSIRQDDSVRVQGKPVFLARLSYYDSENTEKPYDECAGMDRYYVIGETGGSLEITPLACNEVVRIVDAAYQTDENISGEIQLRGLFRRRSDASSKSVWEPLYDTLQTKLIPTGNL